MSANKPYQGSRNVRSKTSWDVFDLQEKYGRLMDERMAYFVYFSVWYRCLESWSQKRVAVVTTLSRVDLIVSGMQFLWSWLK